MANIKKFLDSEGLTILCRKFQDYPDNEILGTVINAIDNIKVDKVEGKDLSTNDYTNEDKERLNSSITFNEQILTESQQTQARANIGAQIIKRTGTTPDHDNLPLTGKTVTLRGGMFTGANNYVTDAENLIPYPYSYSKASPRVGISFSNTGRLLHVSGTSTASSNNISFTPRVALPENVAAGDALILRLFTTAACPSSFSIRVYFYDASQTLLKKFNATATAYENSVNITVPENAAYMDGILYFPASGETVDATLMPVLLRADAAVEQYDPLAEGALLTIPASFNGKSHLSSFPCDLRVEYPMETQPYIDEDRSCVTPEAFGAEGNGNTDDTAALHAALAWAKAKGIALRAYRKYKTSNTLHIDWDGADVEIHELIHTGADAAIQIENSNVQLTTHIVRSSGSGVVLRSDNSPILNCIYHLGEVHASGNAFSVVVSNYPISIQQVYFSVLDAGKVGDCVNYSRVGDVASAYCGEFMYHGGIVKNGQWAFNGLMGTTKLFNVDIENNVHGGILTKGSIYGYGLRITEDLRDLPGPMLKIVDTNPTGILDADHAIDLAKIDLSEARDWYTTPNAPDNQKIYYTNGARLCLRNGVTNGVGLDEDGVTPVYKHDFVFGETADIIGKKILIRGLPPVRRVITDAEFDMSANAITSGGMIPTIYVAGAKLSVVRLHPSFASFCQSHVTVVQTESEKIQMYNCEGHLIFDGTGYGAGTFQLEAYHDYDDNAGYEYALGAPLINYAREKWSVVNTLLVDENGNATI